MPRLMPGRRPLAALVATVVAVAGVLGVAAPALAQSTGGAPAGAPPASGAPAASAAGQGTGTAVGLIQADSTARVDFGNVIQFQVRAIGAESIANILFLYQVDDSNVQ